VNPLYLSYSYKEIQNIPWEAIVLLTKIDPLFHFSLPSVYISLSSSALVKTPALGVQGKYVFLYKLIEPYSLWRNDVLPMIIDKFRRLYPDSQFLVPSTWSEFKDLLESLTDDLDTMAFNRDVEQEIEILIRKLFIKSWQGLKVLRAESSASRERAAALAAQLAEREQALAGLRAELSSSRERVAGLEAQLAEQEQQNTALTLQKAALQQELDATCSRYENLQQYQQEREQIIQNLNNNLLAIYNSKAWKIIEWMRRVRLWLAPKGSWREKLAKHIFHLSRKLVSFS
jgi:regulator of replication initiation timing